MLDHIGLQARDVEASLTFYLRTFAAIGMREAMRFPVGDDVFVGLSGPDGVPDFWLGPPTGDETRELHVAFRAPDRAAVDAVHEAAVAGRGGSAARSPRMAGIRARLLRSVPARSRRPQRRGRAHRLNLGRAAQPGPDPRGGPAGPGPQDDGAVTPAGRSGTGPVVRHP